MSQRQIPVTVVATVFISTMILAGQRRTAAEVPPPQGVDQSDRPACESRIPVQSLRGSASAVRVIHRSGSYYLTSNLVGEEGRSGLEIVVDDVTIDLNGFALIGVPGSVDGISVAPQVRNLAVRNGTIRDWGNFGIGPQDRVNPPANGQYDGLRLADNGNHGLFVGEGSRVVDSSVRGGRRSGADGINVGRGSIASGCTAIGNNANGFLGGEDCVFETCTSVENGPPSFADGFQVGSGSVLRGCVARGNSGDGITVHPGHSSLVVTSCVSVSNAKVGVNAPGSLIRGNTAWGNGAEAIRGPGSTVLENHTN